MTNNHPNLADIISELDKTVSEMQTLFSSLKEDQINEVPYEGSWSAAQVVRHVVKSTRGISKAIQKAATAANRNPEERISDLKSTFLDSPTKMQSPEFIVPENGPYDKATSITELKTAFDQLKVNAGRANLHELVQGPPLGDITKWEMLHFVLYHTQRHLHQLKKIIGSVIETR